MKEEQSSFEPGNAVEIIEGPFTKAIGKVKDVNNNKRMLAVVMKESPRGIIAGDLLIELKFQEVRKIASSGSSGDKEI